MRINERMKVFGFLNERISVVAAEAGFVGRLLGFLEIGTVASLAGNAFCDVHLSAGFC